MSCLVTAVTQVYPVSHIVALNSITLGETHCHTWLPASITLAALLILHIYMHQVQGSRMQSTRSISSILVEQLVHQIFTRRRISAMDQHLLMSALLSEDSISSQQQILINKMFEALKNGLIKVVD